MAENDLDCLRELLSDASVMRFLEPPYTPEQAKAFLETAGLADPPLVYAAEASGKFIGYVIYHAYDANSVEIGWVLKKDVWGQGYAQQLTEMMIEKAKSEHKSVILECSPEQYITKHIAEKLGFSYIGKRECCDVFRLE